MTFVIYNSRSGAVSIWYQAIEQNNADLNGYILMNITHYVMHFSR